MSFVYHGNAAEDAAAMNRAIRQRVKDAVSPNLQERVDDVYEALGRYEWLDKYLGRMAWMCSVLVAVSVFYIWAFPMKNEAELARMIPSLAPDAAILTCLLVVFGGFAVLAVVGVWLAKMLFWQAKRDRALVDLRSMAMHPDNQEILRVMGVRDKPALEAIERALSPRR